MAAAPSRIPLSEAVEEFLSWQELDRHRSPGTIREYRRDLDGFAAFAGGDQGVPDVAGIDRDLLRAYQRHLARLQVGHRRAAGPLAVATRTRRLVVPAQLPALLCPGGVAPRRPGDDHRPAPASRAPPQAARGRRP